MGVLIRQIYILNELYHQIFKYPRKSAQIVINTPKGIILVKPTYNPYYFFPGGGFKKNETPQQVIIRETQEEISLCLDPQKIKTIGVFVNNKFGWKDTIFLYSYFLNSCFDIHPKLPEIEKVFYATSKNFTHLPLSPATKHRLLELFYPQKYHCNFKW